jgi:hypothetical protein
VEVTQLDQPFVVILQLIDPANRLHRKMTKHPPEIHLDIPFDSADDTFSISSLE